MKFANAVGQSKRLYLIPLLVVLVLGVGLRLVNLTNPPLDFHAWRQLRSATIARGLYYQSSPTTDPALRSKAVALAELLEPMEPPIFEGLVALTYRLVGGEYLLVARLYAILFWTIGGLALFSLARKMTSVEGALVSLAFYLFLPFGVLASRSFQPDPFMVMWVILSAYALYHWTEVQNWKWTILAGLFSGLAILIKVFAVFPIAAIAIPLVLFTFSFRKAIVNRQVWAVAAIAILIPSIYYFGIVGNQASSYVNGWVLGFKGLLIQISFYKLWFYQLRVLIGLVPLLLGLAGTIMLRKKALWLMLGLWAGYFLIGISVPSLIITHSYYNLFAIPVVALSLAPLTRLLSFGTGISRKVLPILLMGLVVSVSAYSALKTRGQLLAQDYRPEVKGWVKMGRELPQNSRIIGITHDYNMRVIYYGWTPVEGWPLQADAEMGVLAGGNQDMSDPYWNDYFQMRANSADYFLVTNMVELDLQPLLKENLAKYPSVSGDGYVLYDLRKPNP